jgi:hypothetical protein
MRRTRLENVAFVFISQFEKQEIVLIFEISLKKALTLAIAILILVVGEIVKI